MIFKSIKFNQNDAFESERAIERAVEILRAGGLVIHPTDTCYGIAADFFNEKAIKNVYTFKGRDYQKPLFIIVKDMKEFNEYGMHLEIIEKIINKYPNNQFTFITKKKKSVPPFLNIGYGTIGIQIPKIDFSLRLLKEYGNPLIGTSANFSGEKECYNTDGLKNLTEKNFDFPGLILDAGPLIKRPVSTVIEICENGEIKIIRQGELENFSID